MVQSILAARTGFSVGESILSVEKLVKSAADLGEKAVAIMDVMSVTAMIDFTNKAKAAGVKPIIGCRLRLLDDTTWRKTKEDKKAPPEYFVNYIVRTKAGLDALFRLLTLANSDDRFYNVPKLSFDDLYKELERVTEEDVYLTTGDAYSVLHHENAIDIIEKLTQLLSRNSVFANLVPIDSPYWDTISSRAIEAAEKLGLRMLVSRPANYFVGGADSAEIMNAIVKNNKVTDPWHNSPFNRDLHPVDKKELIELCKGAIARLSRRGITAAVHFKHGLENTDRIVDGCSYEWSKQPVSLPKMAPDEFAAVVEECKKGWSTRFSGPIFDHQPSLEELEKVYRPRLAYELSVLKKLSFSGYFLLVQDVVQYAKKNGIFVGPGRGSVGGSLVAYLMGITDCDPIRFGLLFERFINPDRLDLPDADLDFMSERRHEIVEYLVEKYGDKRVAGVSNFLKIGPSLAIRDVSRVFNLSEDDYRCSKLAPKEHGQSKPLTAAADEIAEIGEFRDRYPNLWKPMLELEGAMKTLGQHAAGIVVGGCDLVERAVIERRSGQSVVCWDKRIVEDQGLVKMDILGLNTLDLIKKTLDYIRSRHSTKVDLMRIPLDDPKILDNFAKGITTGIFQFESGGMRRLLRELGSDGTITFDDITAATALYRPGPMDSGMMDSYYKRKQGREPIEYEHPAMTKALEATYGVMVYQEQVMQVSRDFAGFTAAEADHLRKAMGKKDLKKMAEQREKFVEGAVKTTGVDPDLAGDIFDKIAKFAGYGFNKSHSVEYTLISYQCMYLKTYFPVEFFAAALSMMKEDKLPALLKDADRMGIEVMLPDINTSTHQFEILTDKKLCIPFSRIKGVSEAAAKQIVEARKTGRFVSAEDFGKRCRGRLIHKGKIEVMDKVGCFASIEPTQPSARDPSRIKDQLEFIPGLISSVVPIGHDLRLDTFAKQEILKIVQEYTAKHGPSGEEDGIMIKPVIGAKAKFMVITDAPTNDEERAGKLTFGNSFGSVLQALINARLSRVDAYWTTLLKRTKSGRSISADEIKKYVPYLKREIEVLKPPLIVLLGSSTVRQFIPDFKGKASEAAGTVLYSPELDANLVVGFSPGEIYYDEDKQVLMNDLFEAIADYIS